MSGKPTYEELAKRVKALERSAFELKETQKALDRSEKRYRQLYEKAPVMVHSIDSNGNLLMVSDYWLSVLGYEREEVVGQKSTDFLTQESREMAVNVYLPEYLKTGQAKNVPYQMVKKNGDIIDVLLSAISETDEKGNIIRSFAVIIDITEHKRAEKNLKIYENIVSSTPDGIAFLNKNYRYGIVNDAYEKFSGKNRKQLIGLTVAEYLGKKVFTKHVKPHLEECLTGKTVSFQEWFHYSKLGERFTEITYFPYRDAHNRIVGVVANTRDITEQKLAQEALQKSYRDLEIRAKITELFLTSPEEHLYNDILTLLHDEFRSRYGYIGYIDASGDLICPSLSKNIAKKFLFPNEGSVAPKEYNHGIWKKSITKKKSQLYNNKKLAPRGRLPLHNYLIVPVIANEELIGQVALADKSTDFNPGDLKKLESLSRFIAPILRIFLDKEAAQNDLRSHAKKLKEKNIAMNVLLENREEEKKKQADAILENFDRLVFPYFEKLKNYQNKEDIFTIIGIIETNMRESLSLLKKTVSSTYRTLTPMEIQVADLIKAGKTSKQIATMLNISPRSVFFHRNNIREKLKIHKTKTNLRSFLISLS